MIKLESVKKSVYRSVYRSVLLSVSESVYIPSLDYVRESISDPVVEIIVFCILSTVYNFFYND